MITAASGPLEATAGRLHAVYVSLNSPVVTVDSLPVGPAAAVVAVHGRAGATLMVRSTRTGTVAFFHADAAGADEIAPEEAFSHAESLGFLFEEDDALGGPGLSRPDWPAWLAELFAPGPGGDPEIEAPLRLSKFRWAPPAAAEAALWGSEAPEDDVRLELSSRF